MRQIRKIVSCPTGYDVYGITIPPAIASEFSGVSFRVVAKGDDLVLQSGSHRR